ncbi:MAG TPA: nuclear transport factor 2 family protein [Rhizomicrobium sp.]
MADARQAVEAYFAAWNERDAGRIASLLAAAVAEDAVLTASYHSVTGRAALADFIIEFRRARPDDHAVLTSQVETIGNFFRFTGRGEQPDGTVYSEVMDMGELDSEGRIKRLSTFDTLLPPSP